MNVLIESYLGKAFFLFFQKNTTAEKEQNGERDGGTVCLFFGSLLYVYILRSIYIEMIVLKKAKSVCILLGTCFDFFKQQSYKLQY